MTGFSRLPTLTTANDQVEPESANSAKRRPSGDHVPANSVSLAESFKRCGAPPDNDIIHVRKIPPSDSFVKITRFPSGETTGSINNRLGLPGKSLCVTRGWSEPSADRTQISDGPLRSVTYASLSVPADHAAIRSNS